MNNQEKNKFLGMLYDILIDEGIIKYEDKPKDLKEKNERIEKYLRIKKGHQDRDYKDGTEERINRIKQLYYDRYIIKESDIPDKYFEGLQRQYLEQGYGHINLVNPKNDVDKSLRNEHIQTVIREQKDSLDNWLNYFLSKDSSYLEMWAKVWAFHGMLRIGNLNVGKDGYERRSKTNVNPFVSFDAEILGKCVDLVKETFEKKELTDEEIKKLVSSGSFPKLYGNLLANKKQIKAETTEGIWIKYNRETEKSIEEKLKSGQEPEYIKLYNSLQGYNTGWCTAGARETAKSQILGGDFYVYYSKDKDGEYKIPRLAIRMEESNIREIRGIADNQNIESNMEKILAEKLREFPDRDRYKKRVSDMKYLTIIYNKHLNGEELTKEDLIFVYEIYNKIEGFGYDKDPRIEEILGNRNKRKDLSYVLDCTEEEIGLTKEDFDGKKKLKYYDGNLDLSSLTSGEGLVLPEILNGYLDLSSLTSAEGLVLPEILNGYLDLSSLKSAEGLVLPKTLNGHLALSSLTSAEGLVLPEILNGYLDLSSLTSAEGLVLPEILNGYLDLSSLTSAEGLVLPETLNGSLYLSSLTSAEELELPKTLNGNLDLSSLTSAEELVLPETLNGYLDLPSLTSAERLVLPETLNGHLDLRSLTGIERLVLPETLNGYLDLSSLTSVEELVLPETFNGELHLSSLKSAERLVLPETYNHSLYLDSLTSAEGLVLPKTLNGHLALSSLTSAEGLVLPKTLNGSLILDSLTSAERLVLPETLNGSLYLSRLTSLAGITLPQEVPLIYVYGASYTLDQVKEMQRQEEEQLKNNKPKGLSRVRQEGFISNTIIIFNIILFGILSFILTLLIIK